MKRQKHKILIEMLFVLIVFGIGILVGYSIHRIGTLDFIDRDVDIISPDAFKNDAEWQGLMVMWVDLQKLKSWTPEYSKQEESYRQAFAEYLLSDIHREDYLNSRCIILAYHNTKLEITQYHERIGNTHWRKASWEDVEMIQLIGRLQDTKENPELVKALLYKFLDAQNNASRISVSAAQQQLLDIEKEYGLK